MRVIEHPGPFKVELDGNSHLKLYVRPGTDAARREKVLYDWYRSELKARIPEMTARWEPVIGVRVAQWGVKRMKTRWGTCNIDARRIWLNLELARKPLRCLEYVTVHEMIHLLEQSHNERFLDLMDQFMPRWRRYRDELNSLPLAHENRTY